MTERPKITFVPAADGPGEIVYVDGRSVGVLEAWPPGRYRCRDFDDYPDDPRHVPLSAMGDSPEGAVVAYLEKRASG